MSKVKNMMVKEKVQLKRIDNATARRVTFSKRRRGLFKKAEELSVLCDADVAVILLSSSEKLFHYSSSRYVPRVMCVSVWFYGFCWCSMVFMDGSS